MLRPTFFEFESDPRTFVDGDDFMLGPHLLVASVVEPGARQRRVYLPSGPAEWTDFWTARAYPAGRQAVVDAPLTRIPLFVPAGAIIPFTDTTAFDALHDEPTRQLRVFPAHGDHESTFVLYEDDGLTNRHEDGEFAEVAFALRSTRRTIELVAERTGEYRVPSSIRVVLPPGERRRLVLRGEGVALTS
jgi:alpha-glucosidase